MILSLLFGFGLESRNHYWRGLYSISERPFPPYVNTAWELDGGSGALLLEGTSRC